MRKIIFFFFQYFEILGKKISGKDKKICYE
jgi:hypothetical protein